MKIIEQKIYIFASFFPCCIFITLPQSIWILLGSELLSQRKAKSQQYCGPNGPTASIFYGILITQSGAMVFVLNLDKILLKQLFPTMNI